jgi:hypothetical protein
MKGIEFAFLAAGAVAGALTRKMMVIWHLRVGISIY